MKTTQEIIDEASKYALEFVGDLPTPTLWHKLQKARQFQLLQLGYFRINGHITQRQYNVLASNGDIMDAWLFENRPPTNNTLLKNGKS